MNVPKVAGWLTVDEAAKAARLSTATIRREIAAGRLVACRVGKCVRVRPDDLEEW